MKNSLSMKNFLLSFAAICFVLTLLVGVLAGWVVSHPIKAVGLFPFEYIRPLHTLFALGWVILGTIAVSQAVMGNPPGIVQSGLFIGGMILIVVLTLMGFHSGREYISWPAVASLPIMVGLILAAITVFRKLSEIAKRNLDAAWMIGIGSLLLPLGLAEVHLFLVPEIGFDPARDLTVQWHALDTMIGAWNIILFGVGLLIVKNSTTYHGSTWHRILFIVAASGLLLTYSHHHYPSPQPHWLKDIAFYSTLLAAIGFVHHLRIWKRCPADVSLSGHLLYVAGNWTLFAIATGFLMALPPLNTITHGTYVVVAHAMGSMIGVNSMILLAVGLYLYPAPTKYHQRLHRFIRMSNVLLTLMVAELMIAGLLKGYLRINGDFYVYRETVQNSLIALPIIGLGLCVVLLPLILGIAWWALLPHQKSVNFNTYSIKHV